MHRSNTYLVAFVFACSAVAAVVNAQEVTRTPLTPDHFLLGTWRLMVPNSGCFETYKFKADGTMSMTSGMQVTESEFDIDVRPSKGFFKWMDKLIKDNGAPDCMGLTTKVGHVATNYIYIVSNDRFVVCREPNTKTCSQLIIRQSKDL